MYVLRKIRNWYRNKTGYHTRQAQKQEVGRLQAQLTAAWQANHVLRVQIEDLKKEYKDEKANSWLIDPDYVFSVGKSGQIILDGAQITTPELKSLKSEVKALKEFRLWKIIQSTLRTKAIEKAVLTSTDLYSLKGNEQVLAGKMMVYNLDIIKTIITAIDKANMK